jgi:hypothetical protein
MSVSSCHVIAARTVAAWAPRSEEQENGNRREQACGDSAHPPTLLGRPPESEV